MSSCVQNRTAWPLSKVTSGAFILPARIHFCRVTRPMPTAFAASAVVSLLLTNTSVSYFPEKSRKIAGERRAKPKTEDFRLGHQKTAFLPIENKGVKSRFFGF
jgi:hypothetical protein